MIRLRSSRPRPLRSRTSHVRDSEAREAHRLSESVLGIGVVGSFLAASSSIASAERRSVAWAPLAPSDCALAETAKRAGSEDEVARVHVRVGLDV